MRYLKSDFIGCVSDGRARNRHDARIVGGGGLEASRIGARIIRESLPGALLLNCGGPEMPGTGQWPLLYSCNDTGNTGFIPVTFQETNYQALATHLYKNGRWGVLQPSCLCVGLPGTLEDARLRATAAFLAGGQIDISDTLVSLPEDRWQILTSTLPPLGITAKPVDLFNPVGGPAEYGNASSTAQGAMTQTGFKEYPPGSVWHLRVKAAWDEWDLVGVFNYENTASDKTPQISRFRIPFSRLGASGWSRSGATSSGRASSWGRCRGNAQIPVATSIPGMSRTSAWATRRAFWTLLSSGRGRSSSACGGPARIPGSWGRAFIRAAAMN